MTTSYQLILKANFPIIPNKKSRKNKHRQFYTWTLERFVPRPRQTKSFVMDVFPSSSEPTGIQLIKADFIQAINQQHLFDFENEPKERDYLSIKSDDNTDVYLHLIYLNNTWQEEQFLNTLRDVHLDNYYLFAEGKLEL